MCIDTERKTPVRLPCGVLAWSFPSRRHRWQALRLSRPGNSHLICLFDRSMHLLCPLRLSFFHLPLLPGTFFHCVWPSSPAIPFSFFPSRCLSTWASVSSPGTFLLRIRCHKPRRLSSLENDPRDSVPTHHDNFRENDEKRRLLARGEQRRKGQGSEGKQTQKKEKRRDVVQQRPLGRQQQ